MSDSFQYLTVCLLFALVQEKMRYEVVRSAMPRFGLSGGKCLHNPKRRSLQVFLKYSRFPDKALSSRRRLCDV